MLIAIGVLLLLDLFSRQKNVLRRVQDLFAVLLFPRLLFLYLKKNGSIPSILFFVLIFPVTIYPGNHFLLDCGALSFSFITFIILHYVDVL